MVSTRLGALVQYCWLAVLAPRCGSFRPPSRSGVPNVSGTLPRRV
ncbi:hypothetical protein DM2_1947 [Halorubrum sp. DM2]|nr:hypothetical protein DM2_1947 [Halorubrum sp. DM2]